jgi:hypothetical protein
MLAYTTLLFLCKLEMNDNSIYINIIHIIDGKVIAYTHVLATHAQHLRWFRSLFTRISMPYHQDEICFT